MTETICYNSDSINKTIFAKYVDSISTKFISANFVHSYFNNGFHQGSTGVYQESKESRARASTPPSSSNFQIIEYAIPSNPK
uniref:Uncharacterized protein n=1 Tax=Trichogramma kaykai TaxID=54128 RepID=A0ABD2X5C9_9HYME